MDPIQALISGAPTDNDKLAAMSAALRKQNTIGQIAQLSGDRVLAPLGQNLSQQSVGTAQQLGEQRMMQERQRGLDQWKQQQLDMQQQQYADSNALREMQIAGMQESRAANRAARKEQRDGVQRREDERTAWKLSKGLAEVAPIVGAIQNFEAEVNKYISEGKDIPGVGFGQSNSIGKAISGAIGGSDARRIQSLLKSVMNPVLLERSGAAVTFPEEVRFLDEIASGDRFSEEDLVQGIANLKKVYGWIVRNQFAGVNDQAKKFYRQQGGNVFPEMFDPPTTGPTSAPQGSTDEPFPGFSLLSPEEQAEILGGG